MKSGVFGALVLVCMILSWSLVPVVQCRADDHHSKGKWYRDGGRNHGFKGWGSHSGKDKGNETTGQLAAWLLAGANLTVGVSLLIRGANRFLPLAAEVKKSLGKFNQAQKKYLMKLHYFLNPAILLIAVVHWSLSRCGSTSLPEWGLGLMLAVGVLGALLKFKLAPRSLTRFIYRVHTNPAVVASVVAVLLAGHWIMD